MKDGIEYRRKGNARITTRTVDWWPTYKFYAVEFMVDGAWELSANGPWDYLANARRDADRLDPQLKRDYR